MNVWNSPYKSHQGNVGLGQAIGYYTSIGVPVLLPLNDTQKYDIAIDVDDKLYRVSIKTTQGKTKSGKYYVVQLGNTGGSSGKSVIRKFNNTSCDILFVLTSDGNMYEIPSLMIDKGRSIVLNEKWDKYKVKIIFPD